MPDFSTIVQSPQMRAVVQEGLLERTFHEALVPKQLFRENCTAVEWPANMGDSQIFSGEGLMEADQSPIVPGDDVSVGSYGIEQWEATIAQRGKGLDIAMQSSVVALANLFVRNARKLGEQAAITLNRAVRNALYNAAESGWTVATTTAGASNTIRVSRLNGFTRARRANLAGASPVRFNPISASNPLPITIFSTGATEETRNAISFVADTPGDELGPGTITFDGAAVAVTARTSWVKAFDASSIIRVGGGNSIESIGSTDKPTLVDVRAAVARMRNMNVPTYADGYYHCHMDPDTEGALYANEEWQRVHTSMPEGVAYRQFLIREFLGVLFYRDNECPQPSTVAGGGTAAGFQPLKDPFAPEINVGGTSAGLVVHRMLFTGSDAVKEYYANPDNLVSDAGLNGKVEKASVSANGVQMFTDRIQMIFRAPVDRLQQIVGAAWSHVGAWVCRTDAASGDDARYKRTIAVLGAV